MQIQDELKEILQSAFDAGYYYGVKSSNSTYDEWLNLNQSKILALGKPRPLAKNKQTKERLKPKPLPPKFPPKRRIEKLPFKWFNPSTWF